MKKAVVQCSGALAAAMAFCVPFSARAEIAATNLILAIDIADYTRAETDGAATPFTPEIIGR